MPRVPKLATIAVVWLAITATNASAQTTLQVPLQFDFLNPGARSLALGSAFAGLADDATSAFTNPAGLQLLGRPEISAEGRFRRITTPFLNRGRLSGPLTNRGEDVIAGPIYGESTINTTSPSFLSIVYPRGRWAIAGYRHELVRIRDTFQSEGNFQDATISSGTITIRELPLRARRDVDIVNYGFSTGIRVTDRIAVGAGLSVYRLRLDSVFQRFSTAGDIFAAPNFSNELFRITQTGEDTGIAFNGGIQVSLRPNLRIGAVYRGGPGFDVDLSETVSDVQRSGTMEVPDTFSTGVMFRPRDNVTLAFDYTFVDYDALKTDYVDMQTTQRTDRFVLDSGSEIHAGVEYVFTTLPALPALRGGIWYDPNHSVRYEPTAANDAFDIRWSATLPGGEDLVHYTTGIGLSFGPQLEFNLGADYASRRTTVASSLIYRF